MIDAIVIPPPKPFEILNYKGEDIDTLPEPGLPYFVATQDGLYLAKKTVLGKSITPFREKLNHLKAFPKDYEGGCFWWDAPKVPAKIMAKTIKFFTEVYNKEKSEAEVLILYNDQSKHFFLMVPEQECTGASVHSKTDGARIHKGWQIIGTIHSHCDFNAFHSGTDDADADKLNGLHITIGDLITSGPTFAAMVSINGIKFHYNIEEVAEIENLPEVTIPDWWMDQIKHTNTIIVPSRASNTQEANKNWISQFWRRNNNSKYSQRGNNWEWDDGDDDYLLPGDKKYFSGAFDTSYYSVELGCKVPEKLYDRAKYKIKDDCWEEAIGLAADNLAELAERHGVLVVFQTANIADLQAKEDGVIEGVVKEIPSEYEETIRTNSEEDLDEIMEMLDRAETISQARFNDYLNAEDMVDVVEESYE